MDADNKLEAVNTATELAEVEKNNAVLKTPATISATLPENQPIFIEEKSEGKSNQVN
jgi:hypothetical protein